MKVLDWTETFGIYSKLILASVVPSIVPICKNLATQKSFITKDYMHTDIHTYVRTHVHKYVRIYVYICTSCSDHLHSTLVSQGHGNASTCPAVRLHPDLPGQHIRTYVGVLQNANCACT